MKMIMRLIFTGILLPMMLVACGSQNDSQTVTIGVVNLTPDLDGVYDGFKAGMEELGYVEGDNVIYIYEGAAMSVDRLDTLIENVMTQDPDLILSMTTPATLRVQQATEGRDIPVVFVPVYDPVGVGLVDSLRNPGGNSTGITDSGQLGKVLEWHLAISPQATRILVPHNPTDPASVQGLAALSLAAATHNIELVIVETRDEAEFIVALDDISPDDVDAIYSLNMTLAFGHADKLVETSQLNQIPLIGGGPQFRQGAVMSYGSNLFEMGQQASRMVNRILTGTAPQDIPIETSEFFLGINLQSAVAIGITVPDEVLRQADEIIR